MAKFVMTVEAEQFHENGPVPNIVCRCGSWDIPHVHGFAAMTSRLGTFFTGYEAIKDHLEDGDWIVTDPRTAPTTGPLVVKDADFKAHFKPVGKK